MYLDDASIDSPRLTDQLVDLLTREHSVTYRLNPEIPEARVAQVRSCGRAAGRRIGRSVRTYTSKPEQRGDARLVSIWLNDLTEEEIRRDQQRAMREYGIRGR